MADKDYDKVVHESRKGCKRVANNSLRENKKKSKKYLTNSKVSTIDCVHKLPLQSTGDGIKWQTKWMLNATVMHNFICVTTDIEVTVTIYSRYSCTKLPPLSMNDKNWYCVSLNVFARQSPLFRVYCSHLLDCKYISKSDDSILHYLAWHIPAGACFRERLTKVHAITAKAVPWHLMMSNGSSMRCTNCHSPVRLPSCWGSCPVHLQCESIFQQSAATDLLWSNTTFQTKLARIYVCASKPSVVWRVTSDRLQRLARKCVGSGGTLIVRENRGGSRLTERKRLYRVKRDADPTKSAEYLKKEKDKYKADLESRKRKTVGNMNPREHRQQRRKWRSGQRLCRQKRKKFMLAVSDENGVSSSLHASTPITMWTTTSSTNSSTRGRKHVQGNRSALYRENLNLRNTQTLVERYKKRLQRVPKTNKNVNSPSLRKLTKAIMKRGKPEIIDAHWHFIMLLSLR